MACHSDSWEEIAGAILHIDALERIGVVTHPEFIKATKESPVGTTATTGTTLDDYILILGTNTIDDLGKPS